MPAFLLRLIESISPAAAITVLLKIEPIAEAPFAGWQFTDACLKLSLSLCIESVCLRQIPKNRCALDAKPITRTEALCVEALLRISRCHRREMLPQLSPPRPTVLPTVRFRFVAVNDE